jgi:Ca-activated chloride channel family protein
VERKGVDLVIVLDTSKSMDANDVTPSRLSKAKLELNKLIKTLNGDRVAIIVFAGSSHLYLPLTTDYEAALLFLNEIETDMIPNQGTSLSSALNTALTAFTEELEKFKVVLLVTDGEDHEGEAIDVAKRATMAGMIINTVAVGSDEGGLIPIESNNKYKLDKKGRLVTSKVDQAILKDIAEAGKGSFYWFSNNRDSYIDIKNGINKMEKKVISTHEYAEYDDRYQLFGLISLSFFLVSFIYPTKEKKLK